MGKYKETTKKQNNKKEKYAFLRIVQYTFKGLIYLGQCFVFYNFGVCMMILFGGGMLFIAEKAFRVLTKSDSLYKTFHDISVWICDHTIISLVAIAVIYIAGYLWYTFRVTNRVVADQSEEEPIVITE